MKKKILILDDDKVILESFKLIVSNFNYDVTTSDNGNEALHLTKENNYDLIITDLLMPDINGKEFIKQVLASKPHSNIYILTSYPEENIAKESIEVGAKGLIEKPFSLSKIISVLNNI